MHIKITIQADELKIFVEGLPVTDGVFEANYEALGAIINALVTAQTTLTTEMLKLGREEVNMLREEHEYEEKEDFCQDTDDDYHDIH